MSKLSIIIPHYNSFHLLEKLLSTIPKNENIQIIVVDDKSNSSLLTREFQAYRQGISNLLWLTNNSGNKGAGACRNIGLKFATGDWVLFADSDDYFSDDFFNIINRDLKSKADVVFYPPESYELGSMIISDRHTLYKNLALNYFYEKSKVNETKLRYLHNVPWSKMIRKSFIDFYGLKFDEVIASNDLMFSAKLGYYMKKFKVTPHTIYNVTKSKGSLTTKTNESIFFIRLKVFINYYKFLKYHTSSEEWKILDLSASHIIINSIKYRVGVANFIRILLILINYRIKLVAFKFFGPKILIKKIMSSLKKYKREKKFYEK